MLDLRRLHYVGRVFVVTAALAASAQLALAAGAIRLMRLEPLDVHTDALATSRALGPVQGAALASDISVIVGMALFAVFLSRATLVVRSLGGVHVRYGPRLALLGWLVPVWGLIVPKRIVDDLWRASVPVERLWSGTYPRAPRGSAAAFLCLYLGSWLIAIAGVSDGSALALLLASGLRMASSCAGLLFASGLLLRLDERARSLEVGPRSSSPTPRRAQFAVPLATAAALVVLAGSVLGTVRMVTLPGSLGDEASQPVADAANSEGLPGDAGSSTGPQSQPQAYLLRTPQFTVQLAGQPTTEVRHRKPRGISATMTVTLYQVNTETAQQGVEVLSLPAGNVFTASPTEVLAVFSRGAHYSLVADATGTAGAYSYVDAQPARGDASDLGVRVLVHGGTEIVLWSDAAHFQNLIDGLHILP
jgi:hypothetical protein